MINNIFVLSPRGDTIIAKTYYSQKNVGAHERSHTDAFFRRIKFWDEMNQGKLGTDDIDDAALAAATAKLDLSTVDNKIDEGDLDDYANKKNPRAKADAPPVFIMPDGLSYFHVKRNGIIFGCSCIKNVSPITVIELLSKIAKVFKDYCGVLSEESIRKNFILLYELLDEMIDFGYPQVTQTERLKSFVYNEPIMVTTAPTTNNMINPKTAAASAVNKSVIATTQNSNGKKSNPAKQKNEIFVDILEKLNVLFSNNGYLLNFTIDGCIQMKSFLHGNPELRLALNEDLIIGKQNVPAAGSYGAVVMDDCNFNPIVNLSEFEMGRVLYFHPPDGEFTVLNYRMSGDHRAPFKLFPNVEETEPTKLDLAVHVRAEMPDNHFGANVTIEIPLPRCTAGASCTLITSGTGQSSAEYNIQEKKIVWQMKKFPGGSEQTVRAKITLSQPCTSQIRKEMGPISMNFEIPMYNVSSLQVRYLRISESMPGYAPYRWVRYVTQSSSYVTRL